MPEIDIQEIVKELKITYRADDVIVTSSTDREEYLSMMTGFVNPQLLKGQKMVDNSTCMAFLPAFNAIDDKPHIIVHLGSIDPGSYQDELTHEFSNNEVYRRWGQNFRGFQQLLGRHRTLLFVDYKARVKRQETSQDQALLDAGIHPAQQIWASHRIYGFPLYDAVISVPPDYVTIEKGFDNRLTARKSNKMQIWLRNIQDDDTSRFWLFERIPYLAYSTFHPDKPKVEKELDTYLEQLLKIVHYADSFTPIRNMRELLHSVNLPVDTGNLYRVYVETEKIYYSYQSEKVFEGAKRYWGMLKDSVSEITKFI